MLIDLGYKCGPPLLAEFPLAQQAKLLRTLEDGEITRVGGNKPIFVDVKLICATNKNLARMVDQGRFRQDLYFRLNVLHLRIPALAERRDDIPVLASYFLSRIANQEGGPEKYSAAQRSFQKTEKPRHQGQKSGPLTARTAPYMCLPEGEKRSARSLSKSLRPGLQLPGWKLPPIKRLDMAEFKRTLETDYPPVKIFMPKVSHTYDLQQVMRSLSVANDRPHHLQSPGMVVQG